MNILILEPYVRSLIYTISNISPPRNVFLILKHNGRSTFLNFPNSILLMMGVGWASNVFQCLTGEMHKDFLFKLKISNL